MINFTNIPLTVCMKNHYGLWMAMNGVGNNVRSKGQSPTAKHERSRENVAFYYKINSKIFYKILLHKADHKETLNILFWRHITTILIWLKVMIFLTMFTIFIFKVTEKPPIWLKKFFKR